MLSAGSIELGLTHVRVGLVWNRNGDREQSQMSYA